MNKFYKFIKEKKIELIVLIIAIFFSWWLMFSTFSYKDGEMLISSKAWSDFASHIPLIRSFSFGDNFPPQYPLFSGPPIKYHFLFFALAGVLEKLGLRIDYALNIPSALGFSFLILMIYLFAKEIFKSRVVGFLSILFFIFNGSFTFIKFFSVFPLSKNSLFEVINSNKFISFGPYDGSTISAFWNLNIYTNQRHLGLSYALSLLIIFLLVKPILNNTKQKFNYYLLIGIILGLSFLLNIAVFLMTAIIFAVLFIFSDKNRKNIFLSLILGGIIALPQYLYIRSAGSNQPISFYPGYLINSDLSLFNFINYWFQNLGLHLILFPLGFLIAPKKLKKIFISFFILFIIGNIFRFSPEIAANHKFFNYFMIIGIMFSSYFIFYLWQKRNYFKPFVVTIIFFLILSGIIDFFPIYNDSKITLPDYPVNKNVLWIIKNTSPSSVFLNTQYLYDNASLAGRKIFLGWPYFAWSQGYDTLTRDNLRKKLLNSTNKKTFCELIKNQNINYAELNINSSDAVLNKGFFDKNFPAVYKNAITSYYIYKIKDNCV